MRLYELAQMMDMVINGGLIFDEDTGEVLFDPSNLEELEAELDAKLEACGIVVKETEAEGEAIKAEERKLKARRERKEREAQRLREYVVSCMESSAAKRIETPRVSMSLRKSAFVDVVDAEKVPKEYVTEKVTKTISKADVKKAIKAGNEVPGCELSERMSLQIG